MKYSYFWSHTAYFAIYEKVKKANFYDFLLLKSPEIDLWKIII